jgi:hypothetical protein
MPVIPRGDVRPEFLFMWWAKMTRTYNVVLFSHFQIVLRGAIGIETQQFTLHRVDD